MKTVLSVLVCCLLGGVWSEGEVLECPGLTADKLTQLKSLVVTEDVHDKLVGTYDDLWGPKLFMDGNDAPCINYTWTKVDDTHLSLDLHGSKAWFGSGMNKKYTAEKVENGVYFLKNTRGKIVIKQYHLFVTSHVRANFACFLYAFPEGRKEAVLTYFSEVGVPSHDMKTPLEADVQAELDEVVKKMQDHQELLREIVHYTSIC